MNKAQKISYIYHAIFHCKLNSKDAKRWVAGEKLTIKSKKAPLLSFTFVTPGPQESKWEIAKQASKVLAKVPTIWFVGVSGSLAMNFASEESDVDLFLICKKNTLWISRIFAFLLLWLYGVKTRKPKDENEKDKVCLNVWVDENALAIKPANRNIYTAHEVCAVTPLANKNAIYESWLHQNKWVQSYWPNVHKIPREVSKTQKTSDYENLFLFLFSFLNSIFFFIQYAYMLPKITREKINLHEAYFHPTDWGERVISKLKEYGVVEI